MPAIAAIVAAVGGSALSSSQQGDAQSRAVGQKNTQNQAQGAIPWITQKQPANGQTPNMMGGQGASGLNSGYNWNNLINSMNLGGNNMGGGGGGNPTPSSGSSGGYDWDKATNQSWGNHVDQNTPAATWNPSTAGSSGSSSGSSSGDSNFPWMQILQMGMQAGMSAANQQPGQSQQQPAQMGVTHNFGQRQPIGY